MSRPQGGDTKLIVSLFEGPKPFRFPLSQYKKYNSYNVLRLLIMGQVKFTKQIIAAGNTPTSIYAL